MGNEDAGVLSQIAGESATTGLKTHANQRLRTALPALGDGFLRPESSPAKLLARFFWASISWFVSVAGACSPQPG